MSLIILSTALICLLTSFPYGLPAHHAPASLCAPIYAPHLLLLASSSSDWISLRLAEQLELWQAAFPLAQYACAKYRNQ